MRDRKVANIARVKPDVIAAGNIGCLTQIGSATATPVVHTVELLDWASGGPAPRAWLDAGRHCEKRSDEAIQSSWGCACGSGLLRFARNDGREYAMTFQGFGPEALPFFKALKFHQSREWFEANRATYESAVKGPMGDLVEDVAERLAKAKIPIKGDRKSSVFRIHRDVRFSSNKDPYKTNAGVALTRSGGKSDPGVLYFHLSPEECFFAAGFHLPDPAELGRLRAAAARAPKAFKAMTAKLAKAGPRACRTRMRSSAPRAASRPSTMPRSPRRSASRA